MSLPIKPNSQYSLQTRLVLAFGILLILFLGLAGFVLDRAFKESAVVAVEQRLQIQVYGLLGVTDWDDDGFVLNGLREARFSQIDSGLYGFIIDDQQQEMWRSGSALNLDIGEAKASFNPQTIELGQTYYGSVDLMQAHLSYASYGTYWTDQDQTYNFVVLESSEPTNAEISEFQSTLWRWLGGLAAVLALAQYALLRWSLKPLQHLAEDVADIESGRKDQLDEHYPSELQAVSNNLNLLIKGERARQGRYRTTLGDLAHSLKTPLAVSFGLVEELDKSEDLKEQLERMNQIVSYQLKRAVESGSPKVLSRSVEVGPVFNKIISALNKVYLEKGITLTSVFQDKAFFQGEESDLMEIVGNLLDNAYKYGNSQVEIKVKQSSEQQLTIEINDDGKGIAEADRHWVLKRGARADTIKSGQGIGLAVAVEIISAYQGEIQVDQSSLGGASIKVTFY